MVVYEPWIRRVAWVCIFGGGVRLDSGLLRDINCMLVETWISNAEVSGVLRCLLIQWSRGKDKCGGEDTLVSQTSYLRNRMVWRVVKKLIMDA
jgi:hypothetical protein